VKFNKAEPISIQAKLFIWVLLIAVFEGAIRKWISSGLTYPLVALRDLLAVYGIVMLLVKGYSRYSPQKFQLLLIFSAVLIIWGVLQILINQNSLIMYLLGLRFWLLYLWFGILVGISININDFKTISRIIVLLIIFMAPLAVMQHFLPPESFWNKQADPEGGFIFRVSGDIVRTTGTFSFSFGYTAFVALATPFVFSTLDENIQLWKSQWLRRLAILALLVATIVSGSRGAIIFFCCLFLIYSFAAIFFTKGKQKGKSFFMIIIIMLMIVSALSVFSRAVDATRTRFKYGERDSSTVERLFYTFAPQGDIPFLGEGIGMGTNFAGVLLTGKKQFLLAESENARIILETGLLGVWIVILKMIVLVHLGINAIRIAKKTGMVLQIVIWATLAYVLLVWPIVGQLTANVFGYLFFGLSLTAFRLRKSTYV
jgi:hypothetical protein